MSRRSRASDMLRGMAEYGGEGCVADFVDDLSQHVSDTERDNARLRAENAKLRAGVECYAPVVNGVIQYQFCEKEADDAACRFSEWAIEEEVAPIEFHVARVAIRRVTTELDE